MAKINMKMYLERNISSAVALTIIMVLSVLVAWFSLSTARKIIDNASVSATFNREEINLK